MTSAPLGRQGEYDNDPIAIVGMAGVFPKAPDVTAYWKNILDKVDAVGPAPDDWCSDLFLDPDSDANDRVYTNHGGFLGDLAVFDPLKHGVMPSSIDGGEPDQFLALEVAAKAVDDAGFDQRPVPGDRVAVILGRGTYINRGFTTVVQHGIMVDRMLAVLKHLHPNTTEADLALAKETLKASLPPFNAEMAPALVPNLVTGRIANRLDFQGANYIIDAACASSLIALDRGVADLRAGRCDMALVGGVHASTPPPIYMIFCQLEALSRSGKIRPFSAEADGTLLAEGIGLLCLKRLSTAEAAGDRIYALVRSIGVASDGRGASILAPRIEGERLALSRAYDDAGIDPASVGLVEAHGTATKVGDATEIEALAAQFGGDPKAAPTCALGSVKSMIGHCLPASGSAGLIKTALALHHKVLPPTIVETQNPDLGIEETPFYLNTEARPWIHGANTPRRAGVNAFGFGGINAHAILEEYPGPQPKPVVTRATEALFLDADSPEALTAKIAATVARLEASDAGLAPVAASVSLDLGDGAWRAAVVASDLSDAVEKLRRIDAQIAKGKTRLRDRRGVYLSGAPLARTGKVAFLFPGEGSQHAGMLRELMLHFPAMRPWFDIVDGAFIGGDRDLLPSQAIFPGGASGESDGLWRMDLGPEAIFAANQAMFALFCHLGVAPDMLVGHSTGEYSALYATGATARDDVEVLRGEIRALNDVYHRLTEEGAVAEGALVALGAVSEDALAEKLAERDDVWLAMDNCPNQKVLATTTEAGEAWIAQTAATLGGFSEGLPFRRAYHCPAFGRFSDGIKAFLDTVPVAAPVVPTYSCLTAAPFPSDPGDLRALAAQQWSGQVRFTETIRAMYDDGARIFVECGPRNNLTAFVDDVLRKTPHVSVAADTVGRTGLEQLQHAMAILAVEGVPFSVAALFDGVAEEADSAKARRPQVLKMGIQPMSIDGMPAIKPSAPPATTAPAATLVQAPPPAKDRGTPPAPSPATVPSAPPARPQSDTPPPVIQPTTAARSAEAAPMLDSYFETMQQFLDVDAEMMRACLGASSMRSIAPDPVVNPTPSAVPPARFPLLDSVAPSPDGTGLTALVPVSGARWPYLDDHSFGRGISVRDPDLSGLRVVPLTFSIEVLAEAAAALHPDLIVTALHEVRASRWLALDRPERRYEVTAETLQTTPAPRVRVRLRDADGPALRPILVEAEVELAAAMPPAPAPTPPNMGAMRSAHWTTQDIYERIMFHGPKLQAVHTTDSFGDTGAAGNLIGMPQDDLVSGCPVPHFETDPVTLDAVGQLVGVWAAEMLPERFHIFPFRAERIDVFRRPLVAGEIARCTAQIELLPNDEMRSDIEVISSDGHLNCRIIGWWDKRFDLPDRFFRARLNPSGAMVSRGFDGWATPPGGVSVAIVDDLSDDLLTGSGGIWQKVLAGLALDAQERQEWQALQAGAVEARQKDWLKGRVAAKDAVRMVSDQAICAADIRVVGTDPDGVPRVAGVPIFDAADPHVSISHSAGWAAAAAADPRMYAGVGIDLERIAPRSEAFLAAAFTPAEIATLRAVPEGPQRDSLTTRFWCAKEAAAKACGLGLQDLVTRFVASAASGTDGPVTVRDAVAGYGLTVSHCDRISGDLILCVVLRQ